MVCKRFKKRIDAYAAKCMSDSGLYLDNMLSHGSQEYSYWHLHYDHRCMMDYGSDDIEKVRYVQTRLCEVGYRLMEHIGRRCTDMGIQYWLHIERDGDGSAVFMHTGMNEGDQFPHMFTGYDEYNDDILCGLVDFGVYRVLSMVVDYYPDYHGRFIDVLLLG